MLEQISLQALLIAFLAMMVLSAFFSGSETAMMALNRYRLRHLAARRHGGAVRANKLLERPDRLIGLILIGNTLVNTCAATIATLIALEVLGEDGIAVAPVVTAVVLILFCEVLPKTVGAIYPERVAFPAGYLLKPLLWFFYPVVWFANAIANGLLLLVGIRVEDVTEMPLSREELRTVVQEAGAMIPRRHQQMLFAILDLEKITVEDIMVPRADVTGIDLDASTVEIEDALVNCRHTRVPVWRGTLDNVVGVLHVRNALRLLKAEEFDTEALERIVGEPYYVPIGTPLQVQLLNFQRQRKRMGLVVNEYGDIAGLVTLEDLLEEIVGEFTTDAWVFSRDIQPQEDGSFLVDGGASVREINRQTHWNLPTSGPKTLNGLVLEALEDIPEPGTSLRVGTCIVEVVQTAGQAVKTARLWRDRAAAGEHEAQASNG